MIVAKIFNLLNFLRVFFIFAFEIQIFLFLDGFKPKLANNL